MTKLSIFNNDYIVGVDYSENPDCVEVIQISDEDANKLIAGTHYFDVETKKIIEKEIPVSPASTPTSEELWEQRKNSEVNIIVPMEIWDNEEHYNTVKGVIKQLKENRYSEIKFGPTDDGESINVYNIILKDIPTFMSLEAYEGYLQLGITFHDYITDYFNWQKEDNE